MSTVRDLQNDVVRWANQTFPSRTRESIVKKLQEECKELLRPDITGEELAGEMADVFILIFDLAHWDRVDVMNAVHAKMEVNRHRMWEVSSNGTYQHIKEEHE